MPTLLLLISNYHWNVHRTFLSTAPPLKRAFIGCKRIYINCTKYLDGKVSWFHGLPWKILLSLCTMIQMWFFLILVFLSQKSFFNDALYSISDVYVCQLIWLVHVSAGPVGYNMKCHYLATSRYESIFVDNSIDAYVVWSVRPSYKDRRM